MSAVTAQEFDFFEPTTSIGGYGELHYNSKQVGSADATKTLDFHRFVLFFSHAWTEEWSFKSELELEHNFVKNGQGELELEQAYVNYHGGKFGFQAGVLLPEVGFLNNLHEPPLFLSVERPDYSKYIIPTTWFGNGAAVYGKLGDFGLKYTIMEGLNGDGIDNKWSEGIRGGREKGYKSDAAELLSSFSLNYNGLTGFKLGTSFTTNQAVFQDTVRDPLGVNLFELHTKYEGNNIVAVFEYGQIDFENHSVQKSSGYYLDLGYDTGSLLNLESSLIPWVRYSALNPAEGHASAEAKEYTKLMVGLTFLPIESVAFKLDYGVQSYADESKDQVKSINLGVGYQF